MRNIIEHDANDIAEIESIKSVFYLLNGKVDSVTKCFAADSVITQNDLDNLNTLILQKIGHYKCEINVVSAVVNLSDHTTNEFGIWQTFQDFNFEIPNYIESITLKWDFLILLPEYAKPQRHTLVVRISSELKPQDIFPVLLSGKQEDIEELEFLINPITTRVDFVNQLLGEELLNIIGKWVEGLSDAKSNKSIMDFIRSHRKITAHIVNYSIILSSLFITYLGFCYYIDTHKFSNLAELSYVDLKNITMALLVWYVIIVAVKKLSIFIAGRYVFESLTLYKDNMHPFGITKGDKKKQKALKQINSKAKFTFIITSIITIIWDLFCVFLPYIFDN